MEIGKRAMRGKWKSHDPHVYNQWDNLTFDSFSLVSAEYSKRVVYNLSQFCFYFDLYFNYPVTSLQALALSQVPTFMFSSPFAPFSGSAPEAQLSPCSLELPFPQLLLHLPTPTAFFPICFAFIPSKPHSLLKLLSFNFYFRQL